MSRLLRGNASRRYRDGSRYREVTAAPNIEVTAALHIEVMTAWLGFSLAWLGLALALGLFEKSQRSHGST